MVFMFGAGVWVVIDMLQRNRKILNEWEGGE